MELVFISGPYRASNHVKVQQNIDDARILAQYYWLQGAAVICPHLNTAFMSGLIDEDDFLIGIHEILLRCDHIIFPPDYKKSSGTWAEYLLAKKHNKKITELSCERMKRIREFVFVHINLLA